MMQRRRTPASAFIALGSNVGNRWQNMTRAVRALIESPGVLVEAFSFVYETSPVGGPVQRLFLNAVVKVKTSLAPLDLLSKLLSIEKKLGRQRIVRWGPRVIDLDLITLGDTHFHSKKLTLPHPRYHERGFVLIPFCDVGARFHHPLLQKTTAQLCRELTLHGQRVTIRGRWNSHTSQFELFKPKRKKKPPLSR